MHIQFLGTSGGRFMLITQLRSTAGLYIETTSGVRIFIDPGSGTMLRAREEKLNLQRINLLLVSHAHPDDSIDTDAVIEAMTEGALKKKGMLACSKSVIYGDEKTKLIPIVSPYHQEALEKVYAMKAGDKFKVKGKEGEIEIEATPAKHVDPTTIGFKIIDSDGITLGFTADGGYYKGMENHYMDCDVLITNCMFPRTPESLKMTEEEKMHMGSYDAAKLLKLAKPKLAILHRFGMKMLRANPWVEAAWLEKESGVKVIAAKDGQVIEIGEKSLKKQKKLS